MVHLTISPSTLVCHDSQGSTGQNGGDEGFLPSPVASTIPFQISYKCHLPSLKHYSICEFAYFGKEKKQWKTQNNADHCLADVETYCPLFTLQGSGALKHVMMITTRWEGGKKQPCISQLEVWPATAGNVKMPKCWTKASWSTLENPATTC